jgi:phage shock protein A
VYTATTAINKTEDNAHHIEEITQKGSELAQHSVWRIDSLEKNFDKLDTRLTIAGSDIAQIKSDVRVIANWVEEQKKKQAHENITLSEQGNRWVSNTLANPL